MATDEKFVTCIVIIAIVIICLFGVHYAYKEGYKDGKDGFDR